MTTGIHQGRLLRFEKPGLFLECHLHLQRKNMDVLGTCVSPDVSWAQTSLLNTGLLCPLLAQVLGTSDVTRPKRRCWRLLCMAPPLQGDGGQGTAIHSVSTSWLPPGPSPHSRHDVEPAHLPPWPCPRPLHPCLSPSCLLSSPLASPLQPMPFMPPRKPSESFPKCRSDFVTLLHKLFGKMGIRIPSS